MSWTSPYLPKLLVLIVSSGLLDIATSVLESLTVCTFSINGNMT